MFSSQQNKKISNDYAQNLSPLTKQNQAPVAQLRRKDAIIAKDAVIANVTNHKNADETVIGHDLTIEGHVTSKGTVRLEGTVIGDMKCASLIVEQGGTIKGNIEAHEVKVHGRVEGTMYGTNVMLHSSAFVEGDIYHQGIGIEMGTQYDGRIKWVKDAEEGQRLSTQEGTPIGNDNATYVQAAE